MGKSVLHRIPRHTAFDFEPEQFTASFLNEKLRVLILHLGREISGSESLNRFLKKHGSNGLLTKPY